MWKEAAVACFKLLSLHVPGGTEENNETPVRIDGLRVDI
jgi:hypothetical protein